MINILIPLLISTVITVLSPLLFIFGIVIMWGLTIYHCITEIINIYQELKNEY